MVVEVPYDSRPSEPATIGPRFARRRVGVKLAIDLAIMAAAILAAVILRFEDPLAWVSHWQVTALLLLVGLPLFGFTFRELGLHRQSWGAAGMEDLRALAVGVGLASLVFTAEVWVLQAIAPIPRSVPALAGLLGLVGLAGVRLALRSREQRRRATHLVDGARRKVLIAGAGDAGTLLARQLTEHPEAGLVPVGFLDDDPTKMKLAYASVPVVGPLRSVGEAARQTGADEVLFAIPSAALHARREFLEVARRAGVPARVVPYLFDLLGEETSPAQIRDVLTSLVETGSPRNVLVIGGAGYIGSALIPQLLELGYSVRVLDLLIYGDHTVAPFLGHSRFELIQGDFRHVNTVVEAMQGVDTVIHLGALVGDPACNLDEDLTVEVNLMATKMIAEVAKGYGISRFLFASTCSVYGASDDLLDEKSALNPVSLYARTKIASEKLLLRMVEPTFAPVILRFGTIYGFSGRTRFDLVVNLLTAKAVVDGVITLYGGDQWRPFVHVEDAARAVVAAIEAPPEKAGGEIFNVGSDEQNYTLAGVAEVIRSMVPGSKVVDHGQDSDRRNYRVDFRKVRAGLGFRPQWTLEKGVAQVAEAFRTGKVKDYKHPSYSNVAHLTEEGLSKLVGKEFDEPRRVLEETRVKPAPP
jgi:nucleoside-diphosphate-sugar epimerase